MTTKKRQHYVWQKYLEAWTFNGQLWCKMQGRIFKTNTNNVAVESFFYRLYELTELEIRFLEDFSSQSNSFINESWVRILNLIYTYKNAIDVTSNIKRDLQIEEEKFFKTINEEFYVHIEGLGAKTLESVRATKKLEFKNDEELFTFLSFLVYQFFRTKKSRDVVKNLDIPLKQVELEKIWPILCHIISGKVAVGIFSRWNSNTFSLFMNQTESTFITSDQPVINLCNSINDKAEIGHFEIYYPISPSMAVYLSQNRGLEKVYNLNTSEVHMYNSIIFDRSHQQVYAQDEDILDKIEVS